MISMPQSVEAAATGCFGDLGSCYNCCVSDEHSVSLKFRVASTCTEDETLVGCISFNRRSQSLARLTANAGSGAKSDQLSFSTCILCHGLLSRKETDVLLLSAAAARQRFDTVVTFDFSGCGESRRGGNDEPSPSWCIGGYEDEVEDLRAVISFLRNASQSGRECRRGSHRTLAPSSHPFFHDWTMGRNLESSQGDLEKAICESWERHGLNFRVDCVYGHSRAATVVALYGLKYNDVPQLILASMRVDLTQGVFNHMSEDQKQKLLSLGEPVCLRDSQGHTYEVRPEGVSRRQKLDMTTRLKQLGEIVRKNYSSQDGKVVQSLAIIHAMDDQTTMYSEAEKAFSLLTTLEIDRERDFAKCAEGVLFARSKDGLISLFCLIGGGHSFTANQLYYQNALKIIFHEKNLA